MSAKTLEEFLKEYHSGFNPITGEQNLFRDLTDQMIWDAAISSILENVSGNVSPICPECGGSNTHKFERPKNYECHTCGEYW